MLLIWLKLKKECALQHRKTRIHNFFCVKRNVCRKKDIFSLKETTFSKQNKKKYPKTKDHIVSGIDTQIYI